jgi:beta-mannosidase
MQLALTGLLATDVDPAQVVVSAELDSGTRLLSSNLIYLVPTKQVTLPAAAVAWDLAATPGGVRIRLTSPVLARSVHLELSLPVESRPNLGDPDVLSDDFFDLLPNQSTDILLHTAASVEQVRAALHVRSLADAFPANAGR